MTRTDVEQGYFEWMYRIVTNGDRGGNVTFFKLLSILNEVEFHPFIPNDANRAEDGEDLRRHFAYDNYDYDDINFVVDCLARPCSVLEMLIALSIRIEDIMDDPKYGDRTGQWFWSMVCTLGLGAMTDSNFDEQKCLYILDTFMKREFKPDGAGGLFRFLNPEEDMRNVDIWTSMLWYLNTIN